MTCHLSLDQSKRQAVPMEGPGLAACGEPARGHRHALTTYLIGDELPPSCPQNQAYCVSCLETAQRFLDTGVID